MQVKTSGSKSWEERVVNDVIDDFFTKSKKVLFVDSLNDLCQSRNNSYDSNVNYSLGTTTNNSRRKPLPLAKNNMRIAFLLALTYLSIFSIMGDNNQVR